MKKFIFLFVIVLSPALFAQENEVYLKKVETLDSTIESLFSVISGEKGEARDWDLFEYLFVPNAKLIPTVKNSEGAMGARFLSPQDYINLSGKWLLENGFFEKEIYRVTEEFGNIAHVFTTYESFRTAKDTVPFARGINSIQLLNDGKRWWIVNIYWMAENEENPIPERYLPKG
jgi:hypothetical protein